MTQHRPDPDVLLARMKAEEAKRRRGRLKVFFGACAGVGKTYAMLEAARARRAEGVDVVAGWVETHGRAETEALLAGLERLPPRRLSYRGIALSEMDLDAVLERRPALILVDELAHTNAPGSRHAKRWRDVAELLDAGIDVYSTLNVQHLESLNDVVAQITGVLVRETVPDRTVEDAELELVDLPPEDLLKRLREGKVYLPSQAGLAAEHFFREGNLIALRELALRRVAERVDAQMQRYRSEHAIGVTWPAAERVLVLVAASPYAARLVRAAARLAASLRAQWIALHVTTAREAKLPAADEEQLRRTLTQVEQLGGEVATLSGDDLVDETLAYARRRNVTKIVVGKPAGARLWRSLRASLADRLIRSSGGIDVYVISGEPSEAPPRVRTTAPQAFSWRPWAWTAAVVAGCTLLAALMHAHFDLASLIMVYLVGVLAVATRLGRAPATVASILSVAAFDLLFVPPYWSLTIASTQHLLTFAIMLGAALVMSNMASRIRQQAVAGRDRERRTDSLLGLARALAAAADQDAICEAAARWVAESLEVEVLVLVRTASGELAPLAASPGASALHAAEQPVARWVLDHAQPAGRGTHTLPATAAFLMPIAGSSGAVGVLVIRTGSPLLPDQLHLLEGFASQAAVALERGHLAAKAREAAVQVEAERLRNELLAEASDDLRAPLAVIDRASSALVEAGFDPARREELAQTIRDESRRIERLLDDIVQVRRLESGAVRLELELQPLGEPIRSAVSRAEPRLGNRHVTISLPPGLPLVPADGLLLERVFYHLLEDAGRLSSGCSPISVSAWAEPGAVVAEVSNRGPEETTGSEIQDHATLTRLGRSGSSSLGLTICRGIVAAHGGTLWAEDRAHGGVAFRVRLPLAATAPGVLDDSDCVSS